MDVVNISIPKEIICLLDLITLELTSLIGMMHHVVTLEEEELCVVHVLMAPIHRPIPST